MIRKNKNSHQNLIPKFRLRDKNILFRDMKKAIYSTIHVKVELFFKCRKKLRGSRKQIRNEGLHIEGKSEYSVVSA